MGVPDFDRLEADMTAMARKVARKASARTLTALAAETRDRAKARVSAEFTLRPGSARFTLGAIRSTRTFDGMPLGRQFTIAGAIKAKGGKDHYLKLQEDGGMLPHTKGNKRRVTTSEGSREGARAYPRQKHARGRLKPGKMKLQKQVRTKGLSHVQRNIATMKAARKQGRKLVWLKLAGTQVEGIFEMRGGRRSPKLRMVHRIYRKRLRLPATPWLMPTALTVKANALATALEHLDEEVRKARIFIES